MFGPSWRRTTHSLSATPVWTSIGETLVNERKIRDGRDTACSVNLLGSSLVFCLKTQGFTPGPPVRSPHERHRLACHHQVTTRPTPVSTPYSMITTPGGARCRFVRTYHSANETPCRACRASSTNNTLRKRAGARWK